MGTTEPSASVGRTTEGSAKGLAEGPFGRSLEHLLLKKKGGERRRKREEIDRASVLELPI